jgi:dolichol-phosphate mannosyltransferase
MKTVSIVVPFFNEGKNLERIYEEIRQLRSKLEGRYRLEILFLDNHSGDESFPIARRIADGDGDVRLIRLSRNFGYQASILTGYLNCKGDAAVQLDSDGEDSPMIILDFIKHWEDGYQVVYGIRQSRHESAFVTLQRKFFYRLINRISQIKLPLDSGDFRLIDRRVLEELRRFPETTLYIRGLISFIGFRQVGIPYDRRKRYDGRSKFGWWGAVEFAWHAIAAFSSRPLLYVAYAGVGFSLVSFVSALAYFVYAIVSHMPIASNILLAILFLFLTGIQLFGLGIVGSYVGRIFEEVKQRPRSIIEFDSAAAPTSDALL